jgi:GNAT superfamily N-acetyltransferase
MLPHIEVLRVPVERILDLRHEILRNGLPREAASFDGDDEPATQHLAACCGEHVIACVTLLQRPFEGAPAWQLRGMAVAQPHQRRGLGSAMLNAVDSLVRNDPHSLLLWCNARTPAVCFYRKHGWVIASQEFVIETAGPHFRMFKRLEPPVR